ncbi:hypothetical protein [Hyphomonas sp.]|uniref:hypothetical protein n=1 Tax=Hyphomonas sp. TaxID=87 RepID=UPI0039192DB5
MAARPLQHPLLIAGLILCILLLFVVSSRSKPVMDPALNRSFSQLAALSEQIDAEFREAAQLRRAPPSPERNAQLAALDASMHAKRLEAVRHWHDIGALMELPPPWHESSHLVLFPSEPVRRHDYSQVYHPIEGPQPGKMPYGFALRFNRVIPMPDGSLLHRLDQRGGAAIKWERELQRARTEGHYVVEATINHVRSGVVYAPLWLFSEGSEEPGHEFDFEIVNGFIEYNLHNGRGGFNMRRVERNLNGERMRYEIIRRPGEVTMRVTSLTDDWMDELVITPADVAEWARQPGAPEGLVFPPDHIPMFPVTELWRCIWPAWCGNWRALPPGKFVEMTVHGYRFDP